MNLNQKQRSKNTQFSSEGVFISSIEYFLLNKQFRLQTVIYFINQSIAFILNVYMPWVSLLDVPWSFLGNYRSPAQEEQNDPTIKRVRDDRRPWTHFTWQIVSCPPWCLTKSLAFSKKGRLAMVYVHVCVWPRCHQILWVEIYYILLLLFVSRKYWRGGEYFSPITVDPCITPIMHRQALFFMVSFSSFYDAISIQWVTSLMAVYFSGSLSSVVLHYSVML